MPYYRCAACDITSYSAVAYSTVGTCPNCSATLGGDGKLYVDPRVACVTTCVVTARPGSVAGARDEVLRLPLPDATRATLSLLISELVTNSVRHAQLPPDSPVSLDITLRGRHVRLAVHDGGQGFAPSSLGGGGPLAVGGQGLVIVAALSETWGVESDAGGCTVWCEVVVDEEPADVAGSRVTEGYVRELAVEMAESSSSA
jgi:anti-sigma regulatory factor (Ser/Thr protein kinase)